MTKNDLRMRIEQALADEQLPLIMMILAAPIGLVYAVFMRCRRWLYRRNFMAVTRLPGQVVSVGNIKMGGTGKTPVTLEVAKYLTALGYRPVILTRGYGVGFSKTESMALLGKTILYNESSHNLIADEPRMLAEVLGNVPVVIGSNRIGAALKYIDTIKPRVENLVWILDDGYQHLRIKRDLNLLLLDAIKPLPRVFPLGLSREGQSAVKDADATIFTRAEKQVALPSFKGLQLSARFITEIPMYDTSGKVHFSAIKHAPLLLVSGVANPRHLYEVVTQKHLLQVTKHLCFADHAPLQISAESLAGAHAALTTAKDYYRNPDVFAKLAVPVFVLELNIEWLGKDLFSLLSQSFKHYSEK